MSCPKKEGAYFVPERFRLSVLADGSLLRADLIISSRYADYSEDWVIRFLLCGIIHFVVVRSRILMRNLMKRRERT